MAQLTETARVFNTPIYGSLDGMLYTADMTNTPLLTLMGGFGNGREVANFEFPASLEYSLDAPSQPSISEDASLTAPDSKITAIDQTTNVTQIFHERFAVSDVRLSNGAFIQGPTGYAVEGVSEVDRQAEFKWQKIRRDIEYTAIYGTFNKATTSAQVNQTRGILASIAAGNKVDATSGPLTKELLEEAVLTGYDNGASLVNPVLLLSAKNVQVINDIYGYAPADRQIGGTNLRAINIPGAQTEVLLLQHRFMTDANVVLADVSMLGGVEQPVPGKGNWYIEELARTGAGTSYQIFGQWGLLHGPDYAHVLIENVVNA